MAKPIRATPNLVGEEAISFLETMKRRENIAPSKVDMKLIKIMDSHPIFFKT